MPQRLFSVHFSIKISTIRQTTFLFPFNLDSSFFLQTSTALKQNKAHRHRKGWIVHTLHKRFCIQSKTVANNPPAQRKGDGKGRKVSTCNPTPTARSRSSSGSINLPFWVSFVEQTRVEIWKESLLMVQLPRFCMLFPVAECPFSSNSILVDGRLKYVEASSSFFASAYSSVLNKIWNNFKISSKKPW